MEELAIVQRTYDLIKWYVPILHRLPKAHKFTLGERMSNGMYNLLEDLIIARYSQEKLTKLEAINSKLDILRYQNRLLPKRGRRQEAGGREYIFCPLPQGLKPLNLFMQNTKTCISRHVVR
jgi:hypothetical protein